MSFKEEIKNGYTIKTEKAYWDGKNFDELMEEFQRYEKECQSIIKEYDRDVKKLNSLVKLKDKVNTRRTNLNKTLEKAIRKVKKEKDLLSSKVKKVKEVESILTNTFVWGSTSSDFFRAEMMLRSIIGFELFKAEGKTDFNEIVYLSVGHQLDSFTKDHILKRFGYQKGKYFFRDVNILIERGYIRRFERKNRYYITTEGRLKFKNILKTIYGYQYGIYWSGIFNK